MEASEYLARYFDRLRLSASCCYNNNGDVGVPTSSALPPWSSQLTNSCPQELQILTNPPTDEYSDESDEEPDIDYPDNILSLWSGSIERRLYVPDHFHDFIGRRIIPDFSHQRKTCYYQFAVVALFSERDLVNIQQMGFYPSDLLGKPILDKTVAVMPKDPASYRNYIVARTTNNYHSEEKLFGRHCSELTDTPFNHLWRAYWKHNHSHPKCIMIYSWNFPCSCCTDTIIKSLGEAPYNSVSVIVAHTTFWSRDTDHEMSRKRLESKNISVEHVPYHHHQGT
jgi:hypothetical protein